MNDRKAEQVLARLGIEIKEGEGRAWMYSHYIAYLCYSKRVNGVLHTVVCDLCDEPEVLRRMDAKVLIEDGERAIQDRLWLLAGGHPKVLRAISQTEE